MLVGLIFTSVTLTIFPLICPGARNNLISSIEMGFFLQRGHHQSAFTFSHVTDINPGSQEAFR
jgi:hypothetical protein